MQRHLFCLSMEISRDEASATEKLWDCLAAGSVPVYLGAPNVAECLPFGRESAIFVDDFDSVAALVDHLDTVASNKTLWEAHRKWLHATELPHEWRMRMRTVSERSAKCNVCTYLRNRRAGGTARVENWTAGQVSDWLTRSHFGGMLAQAEARSVDGRALLELDGQTLAADYGLSSRLHRKGVEPERQAARAGGGDRGNPGPSSRTRNRVAGEIWSRQPEA